MSGPIITHLSENKLVIEANKDCDPDHDTDNKVSTFLTAHETKRMRVTFEVIEPEDNKNG